MYIVRKRRLLPLLRLQMLDGSTVLACAVAVLIQAELTLHCQCRGCLVPSAMVSPLLPGQQMVAALLAMVCVKATKIIQLAV